MASYEELRKRYSDGKSKIEKFREEYGGPIASSQPTISSLPTAEEEKVSRAALLDKAISEALSAIVPSAKRKTDNAPKHGAAVNLPVGAQSAPLMYKGTTEQQQPEYSREQLEQAMRDTVEKINSQKRDAAAYEQAKNAARQKKAQEGYAKAQEQAAKDKATMDAGLAELEAWSDEDKRNLANYVAQRSNTQIANLFGAQQFDDYNLNPIVQKYGIGKVRQMAEVYERQQNEKLAEQVAAESRKAADGGWGDVGHSALSIGANAVGGMTSLVGRAQESQNRTGRFSTLQQHTPGDMLSLYGSTVRGQVAENISGDEYDEEGNKVSDGGVLRQAASYGYQGVMTIADSIARSLMLGTSGGAALAASGSFAQAISDASRSGATPAQAVMLGVATAGMEYLTEKIPMDEVFKVAKSGNTNVLGQMFKQVGIEISTEELSLFGTMAAEAAILREKSGYKLQIGDAIANGATYEEAKAQADRAVWNEALQTAAVSGFAGAVSGGGSAVVGNIFGGEMQTTVQTEQAAETAPAAAESTMQPQTEQKNAASEEATITVKSASTALTEENQQKNTLAYELATKLDSIRDMGPVSQLTGNEFQKTNDGKKISDKLREFFKAIGNKVSRNGFGDVEIGEYGIGAFLTHKPINRARAVSMAAVPDVIRSGRQIGYDPNWKGRGYPSYIFAAPVKVAGTDLYVAAVVNQLPDNKFYLSEMVDSEGNYVRIEESPSGNSKNGLPMGPEDQQGRDYAGPEELSKGSDPTAKAEPTPLPDNIIREGNPEVKGTGAAEANFSGKAAYQDLLYEGNVQRDREGDVRPMEVPKTDGYGRNVSEFVGNAYGAEITSDEMANTIEELVQEGALGYDRRSNQDALNDAAKEIESRGAYSVRTQITNNIANGKIKDGDIEKAMLLYSRFAGRDSKQAMDNASELMVDLTTMAHMTGRNLQLFKLLRKLTPEGQAMTIRKTVERNVDSMIRGGKAEDGQRPQINEQLLEDYKKAAAENARAVSEEQKTASEAKMQEIQQAIMADAASQLKSTPKAKWDAWRYMAMLGNGKTQIRNIAGNALFMPYKAVKDTIGAAFEATLPKEHRTKSIVTDPKLLQWARQDSKTGAVQDALKYTGRLGDDATNAKFADQVKVFDSKILESARKITEALPQKGDLLFKNGYYASSLAGFLNARGYKLSDIEAGKVSDAVMAEARGYAINEAMKATFNDCNSFSDMWANLKFKDPDTGWKKAANIAGESILPFRRTPANILVRFAEYSPAGIIKGAWDMADKVATGKLSAAAAIDQISAGMTGTAAMALGYFLAKGIGGIKLTGGGTDEDEKRQGHQNYALEFSIGEQEYSYTIDWAAPANLPLFVGANLYNALEGKGADTSISAFSHAVQVSKQSFEPMLQLSCLSSLNDLIEGARYAPEGEAIYSIAADIATGYFTQGIPALARQAYQATQENKQTTFANDPDPNIRELQKLGAQIPFAGAQFQTDKINAWGGRESTESDWGRAANAFANPGTLKVINNSELEQEITRLNAAQAVNVSPPTAAKTVSYTSTDGTNHKDVRLAEEQYTTMATTQGQTAARLLDKIISSADYKSMTDDQKAQTISAVYEFAKEQGKKAALPDYHSDADSWIQKASEKDVNTFIHRGALSTIERAVESTVNSLASGWKVTDAAKKEMNETYDSFEKMSSEAKRRILENAVGDTLKYLEVRSEGVSTEKFISAVDNVKEQKAQDGYSAVRPAQEYTAIASTKGLSDSEVDVLMKAYMPDDDSTEKKYDYMRQELDYTAKEYAAIYDIYSHENKVGGKGTADRTRQRMQDELGLTKSAAEKLYKLLNGNWKPWEE